MKFGTASFARMSAAAAKVGELFIYDVIGPDGITAADVVQALAALEGAERIDVHINSVGGHVFEGIAIYNALRRCPAKKHVFVDGLAASMASIIACAGDRITTAAAAMWMIHEAGVRTEGNAGELEKLAERLRQATASMRDIYAARTGQTPEDISAWMAAETWMTAQEAKERGFSDEIGADAAITASAPASTAAVALLAAFTKVPDRLRMTAAAGNTPARPADLPRGSMDWVPMCFGGRISPLSICCQACPCKVTCAAVYGCGMVVPPDPPAGVTAAQMQMAARDGLVAFLKEHSMKTVIAKLGLAETATEAETLAAVTAKLDAAKTAGEQVQILVTLTGKASVDEAKGVIAAWKAGADQVPALTAKVTELEGKLATGELDAVIAKGKADGKLSPAMEPWARTQGVAALKAFLEVAPKLVATEKVQEEKPAAGPALTGEAAEIARQLGVKPEDIEKHRASEKKA